MLNKLLIANRGEIACRIIKTAKRLGIRTVAIYSQADANALHTKLADEAYCIGAAASADSYLSISKIITLAKAHAVDAIHPGYGFLSENAAFAQACLDANIIFVGPPVAAMVAMGAKDTAKAHMQRAGVPVLPGYHGDEQAPEFLLQQANAIGYPVLLKATAGGGGKGMRIVNNAEQFSSALQSCQREANASFGSSKILIEKYLHQPRHVECQIFADLHGQCISLFERDCSIQRRQQKIIEEAPAPKISSTLQTAIGEAASACGRAVNYVGAGTVEFLLDSNQQFYFMEMNTRLQVEHPVTEMITGLDLVEWQLLIAQGQPLPTLTPTLHGHAIEVRIYAEDPDNEFLPSTGKVQHLIAPSSSKHVRIDSGITAGDLITPFYDPLLAKLICWGSTREDAIGHMRRALDQYRIIGVKTNLDLLRNILAHADFNQAKLHTHFIANHKDSLYQREPTVPLAVWVAASLFTAMESTVTYTASADSYSPWQCTNAWQLNLPASQNLCFNYRDQTHSFKLEHKKSGFILHTDTSSHSCHGEYDLHRLRFTLDAQHYVAEIYQVGADLSVVLADKLYLLHYYNPQIEDAAPLTNDDHLRAPMPGTIISLLVKLGDHVAAGAALLTIEAMKMEHTIYAPRSGVITALPFNVGDMVEEGINLIELSELNNATT